MATQRDTLRLLCKSVVNRLENNKVIAFPPRLRQIVQEELFNLIGPYVMTDQDLREKTLAKMGARAELLEDSQFTESEQYKTAKSIIRRSFGDDELNGFYFLRPLKSVARMMTEYFMRSSNIEEVYESDEDIEKEIVGIVQKFDATELH